MLFTETVAPTKGSPLFASNTRPLISPAKLLKEHKMKIGRITHFNFCVKILPLMTIYLMNYEINISSMLIGKP